MSAPCHSIRLTIPAGSPCKEPTGGPALIETICADEVLRAGSLRRSLLLSDQPALVRMAAGLNFLLQYPHGCTEQRVSRARAFLAYQAFNASLRGEGQQKEGI